MITRLWVASLSALAAGLVAAPARADLLLSDNFTYAVPTPASTDDANNNLAGRQSGSLAPLPYTELGNTQVGNPTMRQASGDGNYLLTAFDGKVSPNQNFRGSIAQGGLDIRFDVAPDNDANVDQWSAIILGASEANRMAGINQALPHFGLLFRANGGIQAFDGNTVVSGAQTYGPENQGGVQNNFHPIRLSITDPTDGNPFDGVGQTTIDVFSEQVNGGSTAIYSFTKTGGGYADNFMNLTSTSIGGFDNFSVTQVPEPASIGLALLGGPALLLRRRRHA